MPLVKTDEKENQSAGNNMPAATVNAASNTVVMMKAPRRLPSITEAAAAAIHTTPHRASPAVLQSSAQTQPKTAPIAAAVPAVVSPPTAGVRPSVVTSDQKARTVFFALQPEEKKQLKEFATQLSNLQKRHVLLNKATNALGSEWDHANADYKSLTAKKLIQDEKHQVDSKIKYLTLIVRFANIYHRLFENLNELKGCYAELVACHSQIASLKSITAELRGIAQDTKQLEDLATTIKKVEESVSSCRKKVFEGIRKDFNVYVMPLIDSPLLSKRIQAEQLEHLIIWRDVWLDAADRKEPLTVVLIDRANLKLIAEEYEPEMIALRPC